MPAEWLASDLQPSFWWERRNTFDKIIAEYILTTLYVILFIGTSLLTISYRRRLFKYEASKIIWLVIKTQKSQSVRQKN